MAVSLKKKPVKKVAHDGQGVNAKFFDEKNTNSRKIVCKEFSYRMSKGTYNALAADSQSKQPMKGAWKQRSRFDAHVLEYLNAQGYGRKVVSIIID